MPEPLTVYTLPNCIHCTPTKRALNNVGLDYETIDLTHDQVAAAVVTQLGYRNAPVVTVGTEHWTGFRPDKISAIATAHTAALTPMPTEENA
ncbi:MULTISPECIES: glutaredoxin family protein [unclassified Cryobacterium]|uniref:glutaredoxin family protein n=1 Tax=unclassified Cryobacterium TaxID=2649013 RepID=UPI002AB52D0A|nr:MULTISPECIES: glutaredoxin family protein [unclassified Cryobacterium]MDY7528349.1 glutaredoxin family protein [Cryobacterium sp. 10C2]MDY7555905.1 glutaredoxin family protein [Cryobacterium sp. 10C3]MEB0291207.1 glutaredoxin family protein [Cryobacterium sp. 10C2]